MLWLSIWCLESRAAGGNSPAPAPAGSNAAGTDDNPVTPSAIRANYFKRYPYAKEAAKYDEVKNGESTAGTEESYEAYSSVDRKCDGKDMDYLCEMFTAKCKIGTPPVTPHLHWHQDSKTATVTPPTNRDSEALHFGLITTKGWPMSDTQYQVIDRNNKQRLLELVYDPERWMWSELSTGQMQSISMANSVGGAAQTTFQGAVQEISSPLANVANEQAAASGAGGTGIAQAIRIVQQAYKQIFVPMALLLLLPGAVLTQLKGLIGASFFGSDEDAVTPFDGILRAIIAIFLIPATQLIVSYAIDVGNVMAKEVLDPSRQWIQQDNLMRWVDEQTFAPSPQKTNNAILPPRESGDSSSRSSGGSSWANGERVQGGGSSRGATGAGSRAGDRSTEGGRSPDGGRRDGGSGGSAQAPGFNLNIFGDSHFGQAGNAALNDFLNGLFGHFLGGQRAGGSSEEEGGEGKAAGMSQESVTQENQLFLSSTMQLGFNGAAYLLGFGLTVLAAYQLVFMCYLFLLGPIAACFFAWPSGFGKLFRKVFGNWVDAVVVLSLWRFYWCVILAIMSQRIAYLQQSGGFNPNSPMEMMIFNCFMALLVFVPFQPFNFNPGEAAASILDKAGSGGGGGGGAGPGAVPGAPQPGAQQPPIESRRLGFATIEFRSIVAGLTGANLSVSGGGEGDRTGSAVPGTKPPGSEQGKQSPGAAPPAQAPGPVQTEASVAQPHGVAHEPPPLQTAMLNSLSGELKHEFSGASIQSVPYGAPPMVPLSPAAEGGAQQKFLVNTSNMEQAKAGINAWQQAAGDLGQPAGAPAPVAGTGQAEHGGAAVPGPGSTTAAAPEPGTGGSQSAQQAQPSDSQGPQPADRSGPSSPAVSAGPDAGSPPGSAPGVSGDTPPGTSPPPPSEGR